MASRGASRTHLDTGGGHEGFLRHRNYRWLKFAGLISVAAVAAYLMIDVQPRHNGGSAYGYFLGTVGALLILWLAMLGVRKRAITPGRWSLKGWTSAHVYLGLSLIVTGTLHTGFQFGWNVHTLAYVLMMLVILSGIYGIVVYATLPDALSDNRAEMTKAQMLEAVRKLDQQIKAAAQPLGVEETEIIRASLDEDPFGGSFIQRLTGHYRCRTEAALRTMRERLHPSEGDYVAAEGVVQLLERKSAALARIRRQLHLRALLEVWLFIHVPVTFALIAALVAHIVSVFFYW